MDYSTPGFPVLHHLPEFAQTHVHWADNAIPPSLPLWPPSPPALNLSQQQGLFQRVGSLHRMAIISPSNEYLEFLLGLTGLIFLYLKKRVGGKFDNFGWVLVSKLSLRPEKWNREKFMVILVLEGPSLGQSQRLLWLTHSGSQVAPIRDELWNHKSYRYSLLHFSCV